MPINGLRSQIVSCNSAILQHQENLSILEPAHKKLNNWRENAFLKHANDVIKHEQMVNDGISGRYITPTAETVTDAARNAAVDIGVDIALDVGCVCYSKNGPKKRKNIVEKSSTCGERKPNVLA